MTLADPHIRLPKDLRLRYPDVAAGAGFDLSSCSASVHVKNVNTPFGAHSHWLDRLARLLG